jgi:hypothetical protein
LHCTPAGAAEPILTVLKNTLLGGATGLLLGGTATLVTDDEHRADVVRWGVVIGTFGGFALGVVRAVRGDEDVFGSAERTLPPRVTGVLSPLASAVIAGDGSHSGVHRGPPLGSRTANHLGFHIGEGSRGSVVLCRLAGPAGDKAR